MEYVETYPGWTTAHTYKKGDRVSVYPTREVYVALEDHKSSQKKRPIRHGQYWKELNPLNILGKPINST